MDVRTGKVKCGRRFASRLKIEQKLYSNYSPSNKPVMD